MSGTRRRWWIVDLEGRPHGSFHDTGLYKQRYWVQAETQHNAIAEARRLESDRTPGARLTVCAVRELVRVW